MEHIRAEVSDMSDQIKSIMIPSSEISIKPVQVPLKSINLTTIQEEPEEIEIDETDKLIRIVTSRSIPTMILKI